MLPPALTLTASHTNVLCNGLSTGSATAAATGGTGPYMYGFNTTPPQISATGLASGLAAGTYTAGVQDAVGCQDTVSFTVTQPAALSVISTQTNVACHGLSTGLASAAVSGGTGAYTYTWSPSGGNAATASNLTAQNYTVEVKDANHCSISDVFSITQPPVLTLSATTTPVTCNGLSNGTATATATGGVGPYSIGIIVPPQGGVTASGIQTVSGLAAGSYTFGAQDGNGCQLTYPITITQPLLLNLTSVTASVTCNGLSNGSATATATGGTGPYTVGIVAPPQGGITASGVEIMNGLAAGSYTVGVQDANACTASNTLSIVQPTPLTSSTTQTNVACYGMASGSATVIPSGGISPYTYSWSPSGGNNAIATNLTAGNYTALVSDANRCTSTSTLSITQPNVFAASITSFKNDSCFGTSNGNAVVGVEGGTVVVELIGIVVVVDEGATVVVETLALVVLLLMLLL